MTVDEATIHKLMILYMLNKLDCQLTNAQISSFFIEHNYSGYFDIQQTLSNLVSAGFVEKTVIRNTSYYEITPDGYTSLTLFKRQIPETSLDKITQYLEENKYTLKNEVNTRTDYYKVTNGDYITHLVVREGKALLYEVKISVPSEDEAKRICQNFRGYSEEIYSFLVKNLLQ